MRIQFERTGGVAGMKLAATIDSDSLPAAEAQQLTELADAANLLNAADDTGGGGADRFQYKLVVESEGRTKTIRISDASASESMTDLLDWHAEVARKRR